MGRTKATIPLREFLDVFGDAAEQVIKDAPRETRSRWRKEGRISADAVLAFLWPMLRNRQMQRGSDDRRAIQIDMPTVLMARETLTQIPPDIARHLEALGKVVRWAHAAEAKRLGKQDQDGDGDFGTGCDTQINEE